MPAKQIPPRLLSRLNTFDRESKHLNAIIETPRGSRTKLDYDDNYGIFKLGRVMPKGFVFPYDFGFIPSTLAPDGDPLDVLLLLDEPTAVGCMVAVRLLGVIEATQKEDRKTTRNDRLIAVPAESNDFRRLKTIHDVDERTLDQIVEFFTAYNQLGGKRFLVMGKFGPDRAMKLVKDAVAAFQNISGD